MPVVRIVGECDQASTRDLGLAQTFGPNLPHHRRHILVTEHIHIQVSLFASNETTAFQLPGTIEKSGHQSGFLKVVMNEQKQTH